MKYISLVQRDTEWLIPFSVNCIIIIMQHTHMPIIGHTVIPKLLY